MAEQEGVIKYQLDHQYSNLPSGLDITQLNAWRNILYRLKLIGSIPEKYQGLGYGNVSRRLVPEGPRFLISGSQTGQLAETGMQHYALVLAANLENNSIKSTGLCTPSSEALTHAGVYGQDPRIQAVIHVHSPELWCNTHRLELPYTQADIAYGTPEMAAAVQGLFDKGQLDSLNLFSMLGHEDGIVAFGTSLESAGKVLIAMLAKALALEQKALLVAKY